MVPKSIALAIRTGSGLLSQKTSSDYQTACGSSENAPMGCTELDGGRKATLCGGGEPANWPSASALTDGMSVKACFTGSFPHKRSQSRVFSSNSHRIVILSGCDFIDFSREVLDF
jgi:hypothetical protein